MANPRRTTRRTTPARPRPAAAVATAGAEAVEPAPVETRKQVDWKSEYAYVVNDLRQLGVVTVAIFVLLLVIGIVI